MCYKPEDKKAQIRNILFITFVTMLIKNEGGRKCVF